LISAGYSRGRIDAIAQAWRRFCLFYLDKGQDWQTAGPMLVVTYLGDLFRTSMVRARPLSSMSPPSIGHSICWDCRLRGASKLV
jgi:hypothetical protein